MEIAFKILTPQAEQHIIKIRDQHLDELATKYADKYGWSKETAIQQIRLWEVARRMSFKLQWYIKPSTKGAV